MRQDTYNRHVADGKHWRAGGFLEALHRNGVPLDLLMTNDWDTCPSPKVYIGNSRTKIERGYKRFSDYDFTNALNFYRKELTA
jgi:hypothetical protein